MATESKEKCRFFFQMKAKDAWLDDEANRRDTAVSVQESKVIPAASPYRIRLRELPDINSSIDVNGYTRVYALPTQTGEYYVDTVYGRIEFHSSDTNKLVEISYMGLGSIIDAPDMNEVYKHIRAAREVTHAFLAVAQDPVEQSIKIFPGTGWIGTVKISYLGNTRVFLGAGGDYETTALTANYYNKIAFAVDSTKKLKMYEGTEAATEAGVVTPTVPTNEIPCCVVTVKDDGSAGAGTIVDITEGDIADLRRSLAAAGNTYQRLPIYFAGLAVLNKMIDGVLFDQDVAIKRVTIMAEVAPTGSNVVLEIYKTGAATAKTFNLNVGNLYQSSTISGLDFTSSDRLGIKVVTADSGGYASGLNVIIEYQYKTV